MIIKASIDLSRVDKSRIKTSEKNGKKYLDLILMDTREPSQYGSDGFVAHDQSKEEREAKERQIIVGNWKWVYRPDGEKASQSRQDARHGPGAAKAGDQSEIPF
jgi:hypothetical protein